MSNEENPHSYLQENQQQQTIDQSYYQNQQGYAQQYQHDPQSQQQVDPQQQEEYRKQWEEYYRKQALYQQQQQQQGYDPQNQQQYQGYDQQQYHQGYDQQNPQQYHQQQVGPQQQLDPQQQEEYRKQWEEYYRQQAQYQQQQGQIPQDQQQYYEQYYQQQNQVVDSNTGNPEDGQQPQVNAENSDPYAGITNDQPQQPHVMSQPNQRENDAFANISNDQNTNPMEHQQQQYDMTQKPQDEDPYAGLSNAPMDQSQYNTIAQQQQQDDDPYASLSNTQTNPTDHSQQYGNMQQHDNDPYAGLSGNNQNLIDPSQQYGNMQQHANDPYAGLSAGNNHIPMDQSQPYIQQKEDDDPFSGLPTATYAKNDDPYAGLSNSQANPMQQPQNDDPYAGLSNAPVVDPSQQYGTIQQQQEDDPFAGLPAQGSETSMDQNTQQQTDDPYAGLSAMQTPMEQQHTEDPYASLSGNQQIEQNMSQSQNDPYASLSAGNQPVEEHTHMQQEDDPFAGLPSVTDQTPMDKPQQDDDPFSGLPASSTLEDQQSLEPQPISQEKVDNDDTLHSKNNGELTNDTMAAAGIIIGADAAMQSGIMNNTQNDDDDPFASIANDPGTSGIMLSQDNANDPFHSIEPRQNDGVAAAVGATAIASNEVDLMGTSEEQPNESDDDLFFSTISKQTTSMNTEPDDPFSSIVDNTPYDSNLFSSTMTSDGPYTSYPPQQDLFATPKEQQQDDNLFGSAATAVDPFNSMQQDNAYMLPQDDLFDPAATEEESHQGGFRDDDDESNIAAEMQQQQDLLASSAVASFPTAEEQQTHNMMHATTGLTTVDEDDVLEAAAVGALAASGPPADDKLEEGFKETKSGKAPLGSKEQSPDEESSRTSSARFNDERDDYINSLNAGVVANAYAVDSDEERQGMIRSKSKKTKVVECDEDDYIDNNESSAFVANGASGASYRQSNNMNGDVAPMGTSTKSGGGGGGGGGGGMPCKYIWFGILVIVVMVAMGVWAAFYYTIYQDYVKQQLDEIKNDNPPISNPNSTFSPSSALSFSSIAPTLNTLLNETTSLSPINETSSQLPTTVTTIPPISSTLNPTNLTSSWAITKMKDISTNNRTLPISLSSDGNWFAYSYSTNDKYIVATIQLKTDLSSFITPTSDLAGFVDSTSFSGNGSRIAVAAELYQNETVVVIVYEYDSGSNKWMMVGEPIEGDSKGERMRTSISLSSDGNRIGIGEPFYSTNGLNSGRARVYEYNSTTWNQVGFDIVGTSGDKLGSHVDLSSDGTIFAVGESHADTSNGIESGQIKVYNQTDMQWHILGKPITGGAPYLHLGTSLSLDDDGYTLSIAATPDYSSIVDTISNLSLCKVYKYNTQQAEWNIKGSTYECMPNQNITYTTALAGNGNRVAFGSQHLHFENGTVHVLEYQEDWTELGIAVDGDGLFGVELVFDGEGKRLGVSSTLLSGGEEQLFDDHAYIYEYEND